jgi:hypothetical protein
MPMRRLPLPARRAASRAMRLSASAQQSAILTQVAVQFAGGCVLGLFFLAAALALDVAGLAGLIAASANPALPLALLAANTTALFGLAAAATALDSE